MSELVAMSFDAEASPSITVRRGPNDKAHEPYGWGFGWYPGDESTGVVIKDPVSAGDDTIAGGLADWATFRSTTFVCHLRGATKKARQRDAQPFMKSYAGRHWIFAHNGDLTADFQTLLPLGVHPVFEPLGRTDSEHVVCWLLTSLRAEGARSLADYGWANLLRLLQQANDLGTANFVLADGQHVVVYNDRNGFRPLHAVRRVPPHALSKLESEDFVLDLGGFREAHRTMTLFSTQPLSDEGWSPLGAGQMLVARRGSIVWNSDSEQPVSSVPAAPAEPSVAGGFQQASPVAASPPSESSGAVEIGAAVSPPAAEDSTSQGSANSAGAATVMPSAMSADARTLSVWHETVYRYDTPVERSSHVFRLLPVHDRWQQLLEHSLVVTIDGLRSEYEDVFGNAATHLEVNAPFSQLAVRSLSKVRVLPQPATSHESPLRRATLPMVWMPWQRQMMSPYLLPPELPESQLRDLTEFATSFVERNDQDLLDTLLDLNETIYRDFTYASGSTRLDTTPWDVFVTRTGVCQDFANLFICAARLLDIPARYRVGYIYTGGNYENKIQSEASHAWLEVYLPWAGWRGFDPTNGCLANLDHVRVACGRNYRDATPTGGTIFRGGGGERLEVYVRVSEDGEA